MDDRITTRIRGQVHPLARAEFDRGPVSRSLPMERMVMLLQSTPEQEHALDTLLFELHDPASPNYHRWLTPEEFGERFGVAEQDLETVKGWLAEHGFKVDGVAASRRAIEFSGTAAQVASAFQTEVHEFSVNGVAHYANVSDPSIPRALMPVVKGFASMHNFRSRPLHRVIAESAATANETKVSTPQFNDAGGKHSLTPYDFAMIYNILPLWDKGIDGSGQSIVIVSRTAPYSASDVSRFRDHFGLPYLEPIYIINGVDPGRADSGDEAELAIDVEWAGAVAKKAKIYVVISKSTNTTDGIDLSAMYAVNNNVAPVLEVSYGGCETLDPGGQFYGPLWRQAAAQGISVIVSSGDSGSAGCDSPDAKSASNGFGVNAIASTPDNVAVGGTEFTDIGAESQYWAATNDAHSASALSYIPETTWNDNTTTSIWASGGGVSTTYATPSWQTGTGVPTDDPNQSGGHHRYLPDISMAAGQHDGYYACLFDSCINYDQTTNQYQHAIVSGTSVSAAVFAGVMALVNQQMGAPQGNPNFHLYPLSKISGVFHDITTGSIAVRCTAGSGGCVDGKMSGYDAAPGYDLATGWGSMDVNALVNNWSSVAFQSTTVTGSATPNTLQHGSNISLSASVSAASGTPRGVIAAYVVKGGAITALGMSDVVTGQFAPSNKQPGGSSTLYFRYGGDGTYGSSTSAPITLTVTPEPSTLTSTTNTTAHIKLGEGYTTLFKVEGASGVGIPSGKFSLFQGATPAGTGTVNADGTGYVRATYVPDAPGTYTFSGKYNGDESFAPSTTTLDLTFDKADIYPSLSCSTGSSGVLLNYPINCVVDVSTIGVSRLPTGTVQFYDSTVSNPIGSPVAVTSRQAKITLPNLPVGAHRIMAAYSGDSFFNAGSMMYENTFQIVDSGTVRVNVYAPNSRLLPGSASYLNVSVVAQQVGPNLTGKVTIFDGGKPIWSDVAPGSSPTFSYNLNANLPSNPWSLGTHTITATYENDSIWASATSSNFDVVISNPDFWFPTFSTATVAKGNSYLNYFNLIHLGLDTNGAVSYQCTGAPAQSTCVINSGGVLWASASINITTTGSHYVTGAHRSELRWLYMASGPFALVLLGAGGTRRKRCAVGVALFICLALLSSCGGGGSSSNKSSLGPPSQVLDPGTPSGTYTLTITATYQSGATTITHSTPVQLIVQ